MFHSPTYGRLKIEEVREKIIGYMENEPDHKYKLIIGTDSHPKNSSGCDFISAIIVHRIGAGGIYFWKRIIEKKKMVLR